MLLFYLLKTQFWQGALVYDGKKNVHDQIDLNGANGSCMGGKETC